MLSHSFIAAGFNCSFVLNSCSSDIVIYDNFQLWVFLAATSQTIPAVLFLISRSTMHVLLLLPYWNTTHAYKDDTLTLFPFLKINVTKHKIGSLKIPWELDLFFKGDDRSCKVISVNRSDEIDGYHQMWVISNATARGRLRRLVLIHAKAKVKRGPSLLFKVEMILKRIT
ncbi:unnamed protein product, partial [Cuscuta epithymum]